MYKLNFTKDEIKNIKSKIYLSKIQEQILELKLEGNLTISGIAYKLGISESTVNYQYKKVLEKIFKVI